MVPTFCNSLPCFLRLMIGLSRSIEPREELYVDVPPDWRVMQVVHPPDDVPHQAGQEHLAEE